jgi:hypothetical protein
MVMISRGLKLASENAPRRADKLVKSSLWGHDLREAEPRGLGLAPENTPVDGCG